MCQSFQRLGLYSKIYNISTTTKNHINTSLHQNISTFKKNDNVNFFLIMLAIQINIFLVTYLYIYIHAQI